MKTVFQRWPLFVVLGVLVSGCLDAPGVGPGMPPTDMENPRILSDWNWSLPPISGTFFAEIVVLPGSNTALTLFVETDTQIPNNGGELVYAEAYWENGSVESRIWEIALPADTRMLVRTSGSEIASNDLPNVPLDQPGVRSKEIALEAPSNRPETLVISLVAKVDATQAEPMTHRLQLHAEEPRLLEKTARFAERNVDAYFLSEGGFDGPDGSRVQATVLTAAMTRASLTFQSTNHTVIWSGGSLEGFGNHGVGSAKISVAGSRERFEASAGGVNGGNGISQFIVRNYGDAWNVDVEFSGEGWLFLLLADIPSRELENPNA